MSTENRTASTTNQSSNLQFNPTSMNAFNALTPQMQLVLADYMKDPQKASYFNNQVGQSDPYIREIGSRNMGNLLNNAVASGWGSGNMPGFMQASVNRVGRSTGAMQANNFMNLLLNAEGNRRWAAGTSAAYRPMATGEKTTGSSTTTQTQSGLGTWLPQVIGAGLGFASGGMAGGGGFNIGNAMGGAVGMQPNGGGNSLMGSFGATQPNYSQGSNGNGGSYWNWNPQSQRTTGYA